MQAGELSANEIANLLRVSRATLFRQLREAREIDSLSGSPKPTDRSKTLRQ
jgi:Fic family protein